MEMIELEKLTVKKLREIALGIPEIAGVHGMKKEELVEQIRKHRPDLVLKSDEAPKKKVKKVELNKSELKKKVLQLKEEKDRAMEEKNNEVLKRIRKRIKLLKRKLRKVPSAV